MKKFNFYAFIVSYIIVTLVILFVAVITIRDLEVFKFEAEILKYQCEVDLAPGKECTMFYKPIEE